MFTRRILGAALAVVACSVPASATISYYVEDVNGFNLASTGLTVVPASFNSLSGTFTSTTIAGITFAGFDGALNPANLTALANPGGGWPAGALLARAANGGGITITFPASVKAFYFTASFVGGSFNPFFRLAPTTAADNTVRDVQIAVADTPYFIGVVADQDILTATLSFPFNSSVAVEIGGFAIKTPNIEVSDAPEPAALLLTSVGLIALGFLGRRASRR